MELVDLGGPDGQGVKLGPFDGEQLFGDGPQMALVA